MREMRVWKLSRESMANRAFGADRSAKGRWLTTWPNRLVATAVQGAALPLLKQTSTLMQRHAAAQQHSGGSGGVRSATWIASGKLSLIAHRFSTPLLLESHHAQSLRPPPVVFNDEALCLCVRLRERSTKADGCGGE